MQSSSSPRHGVLRPLMPCIALALIATALPAGAQQVYRIVGPDGKVTFSDRPAQSAQQQAAPAVQAAGAADGNASLPYSLRQITARFPVTLYTSSDCAPCDSARQLLQSRGIPFSERLVQTEADATALQKISGKNSLPFGTIGKQFIDGFSASEWTQYLDAAGYPQSSQLPPRYKRPPAQPLTTPPPAQAAAAKPVPPRRGRRAAPLQAPGSPHVHACTGFAHQRQPCGADLLVGRLPGHRP
ncbi:glutaredoxin domain-containing protein [Delftia tsuruhatensis]|uniref:glutaredoxin domain-containing protein n=1 Tax=Delftia tsuruhatensis TaxID=180282 RepID=UPI001E75CD47|nr:glutaredoxin domain-containing protein [Delftia tsuruhatensis]CAC9683568.1 glutaredoxin-like protein, YruB-family [Delftia tsuruhatensis]